MADHDTIRRRIRAEGQVQGVFFRDSTRREARAHGVTGWARNCSDGSVEAVFEGSPQAVEHLVDYTRSGPGHASVAHLQVTEETPEGLSGFEIR